MTILRRAISSLLLTAAGLAPLAAAHAQAGKNGALAVGTANVVVNQYTPLGANAAAGSTAVSVASAAGLGAGDLVLLIQMRGALINNSNTAAYGDIVNLRNAGNYELAVVQAVSGTTLSLSQPLARAYTAADGAQVVRIPRYTTVTVGNGGSITGQAWDGSSGGVVALEAQGSITVNGSISATGLGFRGGAFVNNGVDNNANYLGSGSTGGEKGEGVAGYGSSYTGGSRGRGAAANGGGGGNSVNAGGGGGANGGNPAVWTGTGRPNVSTPGWATAWNLEGAGFANSASTGGGRGGYGVSDNDLDALSVGPGQGSWGSYSRPNTGGIGGRPLSYDAGRLFLGGGGGSGDGNTAVSGAGGNGGGLVYLLGAAIGGSGSVVADGAAGATSNGGSSFADGAGGGGGGGAIVLAAGTVSVAASANGGAGGNTINTVIKAYGPGGGGGAGYIGVTSGAELTGFSYSLSGGRGGVSTSPGLAEFPPNGATDGGVNTLVFRTSGTAAPLPVSWARFGAVYAGSRVVLSWTTAQEKNNAYFQPERSLDGRRFTACGERVAGAGHSSSARRYVAYDAQPPGGTVYYRVRQVDFDGQSATTAAAAVRCGATSPAAYPNPVRRGELLRTALPAGTAVQLFDLLGRPVAAPTAAAESGLTIDTHQLPAGQYWLRVAGGKALRLVVQD
ncbi:T9SS type A sorting domain-containing protein [Hymenobacter edaphi]|uniref:Secretion system C-terminal sorting domain-containing protein n=1 Tax=Hymenobacter edaphi TaxID=2211146 RepID=A0A328BPL7_9BACT|nr:T9SS type A sorting domain-containing protein [Hymenobacter edaphi]RAK67936.1 hypothetical protein DLM85_07785 [Hymenobacter edaphi]